MARTRRIKFNDRDAFHHVTSRVSGRQMLLAGSEIKADMLDAGLVGAGSREVRKRLVKDLCLPEHLSANALLEVLNLLFSREAFRKAYCQKEQNGLY